MNPHQQRRPVNNDDSSYIVHKPRINCWRSSCAIGYSYYVDLGYLIRNARLNIGQRGSIAMAFRMY